MGKSKEKGCFFSYKSSDCSRIEIKLWTWQLHGIDKKKRIEYETKQRIFEKVSENKIYFERKGKRIR